MRAVQGFTCAGLPRCFTALVFAPFISVPTCVSWCPEACTSPPALVGRLPCIMQWPSTWTPTPVFTISSQSICLTCLGKAGHKCVVQGHTVLSGHLHPIFVYHCLPWPVLQVAQHTNTAVCWPDAQLDPLCFLLLLIFARLCRDDANTMEVMLNAKVPGWGKEKVKVSLLLACCRCTVIKLQHPLRCCTPETGSALSKGLQGDVSSPHHVQVPGRCRPHLCCWNYP